MAGLRGLRDVLHRLPARARVVLGDRDEEEGHGEADERRAVEVPEVEVPSVVGHGHGNESDRGEDRRDDHAAVERVDDRVLPAADPSEERADHRRENRDATECERVEPEVLLSHADPEQHHRHRRDRIRLEEVRRHPCAVADVVADVVRDDSGVAWIVLGDARFDLADEVGADIRSFRVDAAAETGEDGDERAAEREADEVVHRRFGAVADPVGEHPVVAGDPEEAEPDDQEARDRARAEGDLERGLEPVPGGFRGPRVRADGDVHADEARRRREHGADEEAEGGAPSELVVEAEQEERDDRDDGDGRVLLTQVGGCALLHRPCDLLHPFVPGRLLQQPPGQVQPVQNRHGRARERESDGVVNEKVHGPPVLLLSRRKVRRVSDSDFSALLPSQSERRVAPARPIMYHKRRGCSPLLVSHRAARRAPRSSEPARPASPCRRHPG